MNNLESNIWGKKKFSDLLKEIYDNQKKKEAQISALIGELKPLKALAITSNWSYKSLYCSSLYAKQSS